MEWDIDTSFETPANAEVLSYLRRRGPSAHSDVAGELAFAAEGVPGAHIYCPDRARYAFVAVHRSDRTIVGLAIGMQLIVYRLPDAMIVEALRDGGSRFAEFGPDWVAFQPYSNDETLVESRRRLGRWCRRALALQSPS